MKIIFVILFIANMLHGAEINPKLYVGEPTELNMYYTQMQQALEKITPMDETSKERLATEKLLLLKLQQLTKYKPQTITFNHDFLNKESIEQEPFLQLFNHISKTLEKRQNTQKNRLTIQEKLAFLKHRIENLVETKKENLRLYQLQFAYYKLMQMRDEAFIKYSTTIINEGQELIKLNLNNVKFNTKKNKIDLEETDEKLKKIDTKFIALNLTKERELLSSETISPKLELNFKQNTQLKNNTLKVYFDNLLLLALYEYQEKHIDLLLTKQQEMRNVLTNFSEEDELYTAKYLLLKNISGSELDSIDSIDSMMFTIKEKIETMYDDFRAYIKKPLFIYDENPILASNILNAIFIIVLGFIIAKIYHKQFIKLHNRRKDMSTISIKVIANVGSTIIIAVAFLIAISSMGLSLANFAVIAGALSIGVGFALRGVVSNYVAGIVIMSEKNIRLGHFISIDGKFVGKVMDIGLRATILRSIDNTHFIIPNSDLIEKSVLNLTLESRVRRIYVPFKIAYGSDIKKITKLIVNAVNGATHIKILREIEGRKPNIWVRNMGESFIELELFVWIEGYRPSTKSNLLILIHETLIAHQIKMPYPQLDIHLKKPQSGKLLSKNFLGETFDK